MSGVKGCNGQLCMYRVRHLTFFQLVLISWIVTLCSCLIWQIISFIYPPNEYGCVYASLSESAIDLQKMPILTKKNNKQKTTKIVAFGAPKTRTHTFKSRRTQNESLFGADFCPEA